MGTSEDQDRPRGFDGSHALFSQTSLQILGLARQFDFVIHLLQQDAYARLRAGEREILSIYAHEWTHYFQFLGTSLGNFAAETELNCFHLKMNLLVQTSIATSGTLEPPVLDMLKHDRQLLHRPRVRAAADALAVHCQVRSRLYSKWDVQENPPYLTLEDVRRRRPFALDHASGTLTYKRDDGSIVCLRISLRQILELAAKCNQTIVTGGVFTVGLLRKDLLDYHGLILFMYQEGIVDIVTNDELFTVALAGHEGPEAVLFTLTTIFLTCQIALMLYLVPAFHGQYHETALEDPASLEKIEFAQGCMASSAYVLCVLISQLHRVADHVLQAIAKPDESSLQSFDALCSSLQLPLYSAVLEGQAERARQAAEEASRRPPFALDVDLTKLKTLDAFSPDQIALLRDLPAQYSDLFFRRAALVFSALLRDPAASFNPLFSSDAVPLPYVLVDTPMGRRRLGIKFPWQSHPTVVEIPFGLTSYYFEASMIVDKLLFDSDLACYMTHRDRGAAETTRASSGCQSFDWCFGREKKTTIDFCQHKSWRRNAQLCLDIIRLIGRGGL